MKRLAPIILLLACGSHDSYGPVAEQAARAGPTEVVALLAEWDTAGMILSHGQDPDYVEARASLVCWLPAEDCSTDEPGWDTHAVVSRYDIRPILEEGDSAYVEVVYLKHADWWGDHYVGVPEPIVWRVRLLRLDGRWRVVGRESQKPPLISRATALARIARTAADTAAIMTDPPQ